MVASTFNAAPMRISVTQARWFRFRRSGLGEPFATPPETARRLLGVQAQMSAAADIAFFNRTAGVSPDSLAHARVEARSVVRLWGQRHTLHLYAVDDWPLLCRVFRDRESVTTKRIAKAALLTEFRRLVKRVERRVAAGERLTYRDARSKKLERILDTWAVGYATFRQLVRAGVVCHGPDDGVESTFVHRRLWLPDLPWTLPDADAAYVELTGRYFGTYGPATPGDLAFWCGTTVTNAKRRIAAAGGRIAEVTVDGHPAHCRTEDLEVVAEKPPPAGQWPVKLLHRFDPLLLGTKDKTWLIEPRYYKQVWRSAGHIDAVVLVGGRIAGTWRYDKQAKGLRITVKPFEPFSRRVDRAVGIQASALARFMGLDLLELTS